MNYLPLLAAFLVGLCGLLVKTKEERDDGFNRLTPGGYFLLVCLVLSFVAGIKVEAKKAAAQRTAALRDSLQDSLNASRYAESLLLLQRDLQHSERLREGMEKNFGAQLQLATLQNQYLRGVFVTQHTLAGVEVSWPLSPVDLRRIHFGLQRPQPSQPGTVTLASSTTSDLYTAFTRGRIDIWQTSERHSRARIMYMGTQGIVTREFTDASADWMSLENAIQQLLTDRFEIEVGPGAVLADLTRRDWPCNVTIANNVIHFTINNPGVSFDRLINAHATLWAGQVDPALLPGEIRITSTDPRMRFDVMIEPQWRQVNTAYFGTGRQYSYAHANVRAGPFSLNPRIRGLEASMVGMNTTHPRTDGIR